MRAQAAPRGTIVRHAAKAAHVDAVEREHRHPRRKGRPHAAAVQRGALQPDAAHRRVQPLAPVVEVAGHQQRLAARHVLGDEARQALHLAHAAAVGQPEVRHHRVQRVPLPLHRHVQQAALLEAVVADVVVADVADRPARQQRVAVFAVARDRRCCGRRRRSPRAPGSRPGPARASRTRCARSAATRGDGTGAPPAGTPGRRRALRRRARGCGSPAACAARGRARPCGCCRSPRAGGWHRLRRRAEARRAGHQACGPGAGRVHRGRCPPGRSAAAAGSPRRCSAKSSGRPPRATAATGGAGARAGSARPACRPAP